MSELLPSVETAGIEGLRVFLAVASLAIGERVDAEMQEERDLIALSGELGGGGARAEMKRAPRRGDRRRTRRAARELARTADGGH